MTSTASDRAASRNACSPSGPLARSSLSWTASRRISGDTVDTSAQVSSRVACTNASAPSRVRRRASERSATPGTANSATCLASARPGTAVRGRGSAGPMRARPADVRRGARRRAAPRWPRPSSCPAARPARRRPARRSGRAARQLARTDADRPARGVRPWPARSTASTRCVAGEQRGEVVPVGVRAAEPVHGDDDRCVRAARRGRPRRRGRPGLRCAAPGSLGSWPCAPSSRPGTQARCVRSCQSSTRCGA